MHWDGKKEHTVYSFPHVKEILTANVKTPFILQLNVKIKQITYIKSLMALLNVLVIFFMNTSRKIYRFIASLRMGGVSVVFPKNNREYLT